MNRFFPLARPVRVAGMMIAGLIMAGATVTGINGTLSAIEGHDTQQAFENMRVAQVPQLGRTQAFGVSVTRSNAGTGHYLRVGVYELGGVTKWSEPLPLHDAGDVDGVPAVAIVLARLSSELVFGLGANDPGERDSLLGRNLSSGGENLEADGTDLAILYRTSCTDLESCQEITIDSAALPGMQLGLEIGPMDGQTLVAHRR